MGNIPPQIIMVHCMANRGEVIIGVNNLILNEVNIVA